MPEGVRYAMVLQQERPDLYAYVGTQIRSSLNTFKKNPSGFLAVVNASLERKEAAPSEFSSCHCAASCVSFWRYGTPSRWRDVKRELSLADDTTPSDILRMASETYKVKVLVIQPNPSGESASRLDGGEDMWLMYYEPEGSRLQVYVPRAFEDLWGIQRQYVVTGAGEDHPGGPGAQLEAIRDAVSRAAAGEEVAALTGLLVPPKETGAPVWPVPL